MNNYWNTVAGQGDVLFIRRGSLPMEGLTEVAAEHGEIIVTHSETGHHHVMVLDRDSTEPSVQMFSEKNNPLIAWLKVNRPTVLEHRRSYDTHAPIRFEPGVYEIRRQREYQPSGWRRVAD